MAFLGSFDTHILNLSTDRNIFTELSVY